MTLDARITLGNTSKPVCRKLDAYNGVHMFEHMYSDRNEYGSTSFAYKMDKTKYDTGLIFVVNYERNALVKDCVENKTLDLESYLMPRVALDHVLPILNSAVPGTVACVGLMTEVDGSIKLSNAEMIQPAYPPVPSTQLIPHIPISSLSRTDIFIGRVVDMVELSGQMYLFKHYGLNPLENLQFNQDSLVQEVELMSRLDSPFIINPAFIVVDNNLTQFRGYLTEYHIAGSLSSVLENRNNGRKTSPNLNPIEEALHIPLTQSTHLHQQPDQPTFLDWEVKETWAYQIVSGVNDLHKLSFSGDIKLENIVLGRDGNLRLKDVAPTGGFTMKYLPPEQDTGNLKLTSPRDIFALGVVLWALSEEVPRFDRSDTSRPPYLVWHEGDGAAPNWYRQLVEICVADAEKRPSASTLLNHFSAKT